MKSAREKRVDTVAALAEEISIPRAALSGLGGEVCAAEIVTLPKVAFNDPDPWGEITYANQLSTRRAISQQLARPLAELSAENLAFVGQLVERTLDKTEIEAIIKDHFQRR